ncbi:hypothetical protein BDV93DRAFT_610576 [Ceratobasidium sp. AG-I]|nr:hypothetical protein BDV93DRAFT_610576 [Ceratobasidium sp. AG-I]
MASRVDWGEFEYDGHGLLYSGFSRMPPDQLPSFLLTADGDDRPHAWWIAQTRLYDLRTSGPTPSIREIRELLAHAIRQNRLSVPDVLRDAERNADAFLHLTHLRDAFTRRHLPPPTPRTSPPPSAVQRVPATPSRAPSPRQLVPSPRTSQSSPPGAMPLQGMLAHPTLMSLPVAAPVPVPGPTPHALPLFTLMPQPGGIPVPAPGPNPPPLMPGYAARYAAYTAPPRSGISPIATTAAPSPRVTPPKHPEHMEEDERRSRSDDEASEHAPDFEIDELEDDGPNTRPASKHGPPPARHDPPAYAPEVQPDRPKKRSRQTRPLPSSEPRVCTTCSRTDSPEWRRGPHGPKTLCNACGLKWAKASGAGRRRAANHATGPTNGVAHPPPADPPAPAYGIRHEGPWSKAGAEIHRVGSAGAVYAPPPNPTGGSVLGGVPIMNDLARNGPVPGDLAGTRPTPGDLAVTRPIPGDIALSRPGPMDMGRTLSAHEMGRTNGGVGASMSLSSVPPPPRSSSGSESGPEDGSRRIKTESMSNGDIGASGLMDLANVALEKEEGYARSRDENGQGYARAMDTQTLKRPRADSGYDRMSSSSSGFGEGSSSRSGYTDMPPRGFGETSSVRPIDVIPIGEKW